MRKKNKALALFLAAAMTITSVLPATAVKAEDGAPSAPTDAVTEITKGEATITKGEATDKTVSFDFATEDAAQYTVQKKVDNAWVDVETVTAGEAGEKITVHEITASEAVVSEDFEDKTSIFNLINKEHSANEFLEADTCEQNKNSSAYIYGVGSRGGDTGTQLGDLDINDNAVVSIDLKMDGCTKGKSSNFALLGANNKSSWLDSNESEGPGYNSQILVICADAQNDNGYWSSITINGNDITKQANVSSGKSNKESSGKGGINRDTTGWLRLTAAIDFASQTVDAKLVRISDGSVVYENSNLNFKNENINKLNSVYFVAGKQYGGVFVDNLDITKISRTYTYTFTDTNLAADTAYDYRVVGKDAEGKALFATDTVSLKTKTAGITGDSQTGDSETGDSEITGDSQTGSSQTGSSQTGDSQTGSSQTGDSQTGSSQTGSSQTGDSQTGSSQTGSSQTGSSQTGNSQTDNSQTNNSQTGSSQPTNSETKGSETPNSSQTGNSQTGSSQASAAQKVGAKFTASKHNYTVTKSGRAPTVEFTGTKNTGKTIKIPDTVKDKNGVVYKVTTIGKNAMKSNNKVTNITIGKHVTTIKDTAFLNCTKLTKVKINSTALVTIPQISRHAIYEKGTKKIP